MYRLYVTEILVTNRGLFGREVFERNENHV